MCYDWLMDERDPWADVFEAIRKIESIEQKLEAAELRRDQEIARLYKIGVPITQIARRVRLSKPKIYKILAEQGVKE